jgi:hypothetical protein
MVPLMVLVAGDPTVTVTERRTVPSGILISFLPGILRIFSLFTNLRTVSSLIW